MSFRFDRFEMKFLINAAQRAALMEKLDPHLRPDANADETAFYPIVSMYYDSEDRDCYWEHQQELAFRKKLRVRVYGSLTGGLPPTSFIEIKHKDDKRGVKRRAQMPYQDAIRVGQGEWPQDVAFGDMARRTIEEAHDFVKRRQWKPVLVMRYDRRAYAAIDPACDLRITFDTGIAYRFHNLNPVPDDQGFEPSDYLYPDDISVLEVKFTERVPYWVSKVIGETGCVLRSHSKYSSALERSDPVLRSMVPADWQPPTQVFKFREVDSVSAMVDSQLEPADIAG